ncbi:MAG: LysE family translocator [Gammaproteobacteria bacterium]|nr:LysE family translocator [Gammaproteobacteria bacterium]
MTVDLLLLFLLATLTVKLSVGPSILYVSSVAASNGVKVGDFSVLGVSVGIFVHVLAPATGVAALIAASDLAFAVLKYIGAIYLVYLGLQLLLRSKRKELGRSCSSTGSPRSFFRRGILVDLFNPKIGIFFLAFLPQFVNAGEPGAFARTLALGAIFIMVGGVVNTCIGVTAATGTNVLGPRLRAWTERWIPGGVLTLLGAPRVTGAVISARWKPIQRSALSLCGRILLVRQRFPVKADTYTDSGCCSANQTAVPRLCGLNFAGWDTRRIR